MNPKITFASLFALGLVACGGSTDAGAGGAAGAGNAGASAGASGSGAVAGSGGISGGAGIGGTSGTGAVGGGGASGGSGGSTGPAPECTQDSDCRLFTDCCTCVGLPKGHADPPSCNAACSIDQCAAHDVKAPSCRAGRCVAGFNCDASQALCFSLPPTCAAGQVPSVVGSCWGGCVDATQCLGVQSCAECTGVNTTCVKYDLQGGDTSVSSHCVTVPKGCEGSPTCSCMGSSVCATPYVACGDFSGIKGMGCSCPNC